MFERFTEHAIKTIMLAQEEARRLGHNYVGTEFWLLGLIGDSQGNASKILKSRGINLKNARDLVERNIGRGPGFVAVEVPFTQQAKRLMEMAWQQAREHLDHNYIGTEHLLLGMVEVGDDGNVGDAAVKVLSTLGVNIDELRTETIEAAKTASAEVSVGRRSTEPLVKRTIELSPVDDTEMALEKALEAVRHAKRITIRAQEFEMAAWLREKEGELVEKIQEIPQRSKEPPEVKGSMEDLRRQFTEQAERAYLLALEETRRLGHNFVGTEQILLGLIGEGTGVAAKTLESMGVKLKDARLEVEKIIGRGSGFVAVEIPLTPRAKKVIHLAQNQAKRLGHDSIGTEHLLLGILNEGEGVAARVLENLGLTLWDVKLRRALKEGGTPAP